MEIFENLLNIMKRNFNLEKIAHTKTPDSQPVLSTAAERSQLFEYGACQSFLQWQLKIYKLDL